VYTIATADLRAGPTPCRLVLIDLHSGVAAPGQPLCADGERAISLALQDGAAGPIAYAGLWSPAEAVAGSGLPGRGRVLAIDARSGATTAIVRVDGVPDALILAADPHGTSRLFAVEARLEPDEEATTPRQRYRYDAHGWRLRVLDPATLALLDELRLASYSPLGLAVAPGGDQVYTLVGPVDGLLDRALVRLDLQTGTQTVLCQVPGTIGGGLVVTRDRVYVPNPEGADVRVVDRQGRPHTTLAVGEHPLDVVGSGPP
jgi:DNA-binding beta-propeller fold protein YncE